MVIGGRSGRPIRENNPNVLRGYSMRKAYWSWAKDEGAPSEVPGEDGGRYVLTRLGKKLVYVYEPAPSAPEGALVVDESPFRAMVLASVGSQRFWRGRL